MIYSSFLVVEDLFSPYTIYFPLAEAFGSLPFFLMYFLFFYIYTYMYKYLNLSFFTLCVDNNDFFLLKLFCNIRLSERS